jgi:hypothetical protein
LEKIVVLELHNQNPLNFKLIIRGKRLYLQFISLLFFKLKKKMDISKSCYYCKEKGVLGLVEINDENISLIEFSRILILEL